METALIQTILRVGVPALVSLADMFIELARTQGVEPPSIEDLRARRDRLRELPDLATCETQETAPD
ncbi:hypothetical protein DPQ33_08775 [Oceanidesulfovibrio indonesiensis]|uniref:Uncharacterized protein n=1 Tax=Oceanidesulfovibrio indonesiensis TaxID=54767 RepID=A0A7M3MFD3_9BACT|nr:hypothetical protein [Oceanidesulfovibrio indonesiensis]TVM17717.1 hypothetical protein DPQ33_08775 [Oceanidesulfovibrio indonesiensis]